MFIYTVHDTGPYRSFCQAYASLEEANARFDYLLNYFVKLSKPLKVRDWTIEAVPSQLRVAIISNVFENKPDDYIIYLTKHEI